MTSKCLTHLINTSQFAKFIINAYAFITTPQAYCEHPISFRYLKFVSKI